MKGASNHLLWQAGAIVMAKDLAIARVRISRRDRCKPHLSCVSGKGGA